MSKVAMYEQANSLKQTPTDIHIILLETYGSSPQKPSLQAGSGLGERRTRNAGGQAPGGLW